MAKNLPKIQFSHSYVHPSVIGDWSTQLPTNCQDSSFVTNQDLHGRTHLDMVKQAELEQFRMLTCGQRVNIHRQPFDLPVLRNRCISSIASVATTVCESSQTLKLTTVLSHTWLHTCRVIVWTSIFSSGWLWLRSTLRREPQGACSSFTEGGVREKPIILTRSWFSSRCRVFR